VWNTRIASTFQPTGRTVTYRHLRARASASAASVNFAAIPRPRTSCRTTSGSPFARFVVPKQPDETDDAALEFRDPKVGRPDSVPVPVEVRAGVVAPNRGVLVELPMPFRQFDPERAARREVPRLVVPDPNAGFALRPYPRHAGTRSASARLRKRRPGARDAAPRVVFRRRERLPTVVIWGAAVAGQGLRMKQERVPGQNVDLDQLTNSIQGHLTGQGFQIIQSGTADNYRMLHARKGGWGRTLIGAVRDAEVDIAGTSQSFELTLRTGAWGRDIAIPAIEGFVILGGVGGIGGAAAGAIMAYEFEKHFWQWLNTEVQRLSGGVGRVGQPYSPPMVSPVAIGAPNTPGASGPPLGGGPESGMGAGPAGTSAALPSGGARCSTCGAPLPAGARFCASCGHAVA
jgi:hypothetical protein